MKMTVPTTTRALLAAALSAAAGCSGSNSANMVTPVANAAAHAAADHGHSWMKPGSGKQKLLYVTNSGNGTVTIYTYPALAYAGELTGFSDPLFECVDKSAHVWIVDYGSGTLSEYAHGGTTPLKQITGLSLPYACAVDTNTGDLAVAFNLESSSQHLGEVAVYHQASGDPSIYSDSNFGIITGLAYDGSGNIFVDGLTSGDAFHFAELPAGNREFTDITLSQAPSSNGAVVWDGHYVDVGDYSNTIYQTQGSTVVKTIDLNLAYPALRGFHFLSPTKLIVANSYGQNVDLFRYPAGGKVRKNVSQNLSTPWDVVLSK
ncbi:MAG TPA: hypothetical protein VEW74_08865 [Candidatus Nitrosotalea sp.]|nr:hypothetical protein [Candidatus Nitrosotalea sp.]